MNDPDLIVEDIEQLDHDALVDELADLVQLSSHRKLLGAMADLFHIQRDSYDEPTVDVDLTPDYATLNDKKRAALNRLGDRLHILVHEDSDLFNTLER